MSEKVKCTECTYEHTNMLADPCNKCFGSYVHFEPKKTNMKKAELLELLEEKERDIKNLHEQIDNLEKYSKYDKSASELKAMYDSFVNAGFSEQQAFILLTTVMDSTLGK